MAVVIIHSSIGVSIGSFASAPCRPGCSHPELKAASCIYPAFFSQQSPGHHHLFDLIFNHETTFGTSFWE